MSLRKFRKRLAYNLRAYRKFKKLTQEQLSKISKVDTTDIIYIENMHISAGIDTIEKLCMALKVDVSMLFSRTYVKFPKTGLPKIELTPMDLSEGEAAYAFYTLNHGMEYHPISKNSYRNAIAMMALIQSNHLSGADLLDESKRLHIPYKDIQVNPKLIL